MELEFLGTVNRAMAFQYSELIFSYLNQKLYRAHANEANNVKKDSLVGMEPFVPGNVPRTITATTTTTTAAAIFTCTLSHYKQLWGEVFVISRIIKVEVWVISRSRRLRLIALTETLFNLDITKTESNNCFIIH